eukprot:TRINITY_DN1185_c0_g2_i1.p1 TRINITY_DN1185_c0_g2~~TRINITY_DN1185_c0_g2_i1.p1  ORF type:complete len:944 (+),score=237.91 TRINITY_DN1185_c0_g2_i1:32-2833(+)
MTKPSVMVMMCTCLLVFMSTSMFVCGSNASETPVIQQGDDLTTVVVFAPQLDTQRVQRTFYPKKHLEFLFHCLESVIDQSMALSSVSAGDQVNRVLVMDASGFQAASSSNTQESNDFQNSQELWVQLQRHINSPQWTGTSIGKEKLATAIQKKLLVFHSPTLSASVSPVLTSIQMAMKLSGSAYTLLMSHENRLPRNYHESARDEVQKAKVYAETQQFILGSKMVDEKQGVVVHTGVEFQASVRIKTASGQTSQQYPVPFSKCQGYSAQDARVNTSEWIEFTHWQGMIMPTGLFHQQNGVDVDKFPQNELLGMLDLQYRLKPTRVWFCASCQIVHQRGTEYIQQSMDHVYDLYGGGEIDQQTMWEIEALHRDNRKFIRKVDRNKANNGLGDGLLTSRTVRLNFPFMQYTTHGAEALDIVKALERSTELITSNPHDATLSRVFAPFNPRYVSQSEEETILDDSASNEADGVSSLNPFLQQHNNLSDGTVHSIASHIKLARVLNTKMKDIHLKDEIPDIVITIGIPELIHSPHEGLINVIRTSFETDRIRQRWVHRLNKMDQIWVPSEFNRITFESSGVNSSKIVVIPQGVDTHLFNPDTTSPLRLPKEDESKFKFLSVFEWTDRKGWEVLISEFVQEFSVECDNGECESDVVLYLKVAVFGQNIPSDATRNYNELSELIRNLVVKHTPSGKTAPKIKVITLRLAPADMPKLYKSMDCFVLPTHGEGWSRTVSEAMAMELPVIVTKWGGLRDYVTEQNAYPVHYSLSRVCDGCQEHEFGGAYYSHVWADPIGEHVAEQMRRVVSDPEHASSVGKEARKTMLQSYSLDVVIPQIINQLNLLSKTVDELKNKHQRYENLLLEKWQQRNPKEVEKYIKLTIFLGLLVTLVIIRMFFWTSFLDFLYFVGVLFTEFRVLKVRKVEKSQWAQSCSESTNEN